MDGKEFKRQVYLEKERTGEFIEDLANKAKIPVRTFYSLFKITGKDVPDDYIQALKKAGYKISETAESLQGPDPALMKQMLTLIQSNQTEFKASKEQLERENKTLVANNALLIANNNYLLKMIQEMSPKDAKEARKHLKPVN